MDGADRAVASPEPVTARSLGMSNVIVGILAILAVAYEAGVVLAMPLMGDLMRWAQAQQERREDASHRARLERFAERSQAARTDEERETIEAERVLAEMNRIRQPFWSGFSMEFLDDPGIRAGVLAKFGVLTALNGLLVVSGFGLVRFRSWGRTTARVAALLLIPAVVGFTVASAMMAPLLAERWTAEMAATLLGAEDSSRAVPEVAGALGAYEAGMRRLFVVSSTTTNLGGLIYPIAVLVVAARPGVRAAVGRRAAA